MDFIWNFKKFVAKNRNHRQLSKSKNLKNGTIVPVQSMISKIVALIVLFNDLEVRRYQNDINGFYIEF